MRLTHISPMTLLSPCPLLSLFLFSSKRQIVPSSIPFIIEARHDRPHIPLLRVLPRRNDETRRIIHERVTTGRGVGVTVVCVTEQVRLNSLGGPRSISKGSVHIRCKNVIAPMNAGAASRPPCTDVILIACRVYTFCAFFRANTPGIPENASTG